MNVLAVKIVIYLRTYGGLHYALLFFLSWSMRLTESAGPGISNRCCSFATILSASAGNEEEGGRGERRIKEVQQNDVELNLHRDHIIAAMSSCPRLTKYPWNQKS